MSKAIRKNDADDVRLVYEVPEAGALLGLKRNAAYAAAARGELGQLINIGKRIKVSKAAFHRKFDLLLKG